MYQPSTSPSSETETQLRAAPAFIALSGINSLVAAAMPLLLLLIKLKNCDTLEDVNAIHRLVINEILAFESRAKKSHCSPRLILAARYCLCTALDEVALLTPWGSNSIWAQQTLLSRIQKETWGGERFFIILEKMSQEPAQNRDILELLYIILKLGFEGKYYDEDKSVREEITHRLFRVVMNNRELPHRQLSPNLVDIQKDADKTPTRNTRIYKLSALMLVLLFLFALILNVITYRQARQPMREFKEMSQALSLPRKRQAFGINHRPGQNQTTKEDIRK